MLIVLTVLLSFLALIPLYEISPEMDPRIMGVLAIFFGAMISILVEWLRSRRARGKVVKCRPEGL